MKNRVKKALKLIGSILMVIALIFIVKKMLFFDSSIWVSLKDTHCWIIVVILCINIIQNLFCCIPWGILVEHITGRNIAYLQLASVYTKSAIYKYVPGNIFQYVGRNELAIRMDLSHVDIGISTVLDTVIMFGTATLISVFILGKNAFQYFAENSSKIITIVAILLMVMLLGFGLAYMKSESVKCLIRKCKRILNIKYIKVYVKCFGCYIFVNFIGCINLAVVLLLVLRQQYSWEIFIHISGAYIFAFIVGFITPGVSGGIGVREAVMVILTDGFLSGDVILAAMVLLRFTSIVSDLASYGVVKLIIATKVKCLGLHGH